MAWIFKTVSLACIALLLAQSVLPVAQARQRAARATMSLQKFQKTAQYQQVMAKVLNAKQVRNQYEATASVAAAPVAIALAPAAGIAIAEALLAIVAGLVFIGIVDEATGNSISRPLENFVSEMNDLIRKGISRVSEAQTYALVQSLKAVMALGSALEWFGESVTSWIRDQIESFSWAKATPRTIPTTVPATVPTTRTAPQQCATPEGCCPDLWTKLKGLNQLSGRTQGMLTEIINSSTAKVYAIKPNGGKGKLLCCYEWDNFHGNHFEVFDPKGRHIGEQYCGSGGDPCSPKAGTAKPSNHSPRGSCRP